MLRSILKGKRQFTRIEQASKEKVKHESKALNTGIKFSKIRGIQYLEDKVTDFGYQSIICSDSCLSNAKPSPVEVL